MEIIVINGSSEKTKFGNVEATVEYCRRRAYENFTAQVIGAGSQTQQVIDEIRRQLSNVLVQG
jgi:hypothetical protein